MNFNKIKHYLFRERFFDIVFGTYYRVTHRVITNPRISKPYLCKRHVQFNHRKSHEPRSGEKLMYNKTIILLIWLFFLFTIEHDNSLTFGQEENLNLIGIWDRNDDFGYNDTVFLNQIGNKFTATADGYCFSDEYNRPEGSQFANFREVFSGTLIGNTAKGQIVWCNSAQKTMQMVEMNLTVSDDGKTLDIHAGPPANGFYEQYRFISDLPASVSIDVHTSKPAYNLNEQVQVAGQIKNLASRVNTLILEVYSPDGKRALYRDVYVNPDGTFGHSFNLNNSENNGTYRAHVAYATASNEINFDYGVPISGIYEPVVASGISIAAAAGGGFLLNKHGIFKRIRDLFRNGGSSEHGPEPVPVFYVAIECGVENPELTKKQTLSDSRLEIQDIAKLEQGFSKAVDDILKNRKVIKKVQKDFDFIKWCKETKENPNKILSKVSDDIVNKFLSSMSPYFSNLILSELSVESDISATRDRHKKIRKSIQFNLVPIEPYIEFVLYVNTQRMSSAKFIFTIKTNVEVKNLTVNMTATDTNVEVKLQEKPEENYDKKISIENLIFVITVEFSRLKIGLVEKNISPPIIIGTKNVQFKKFGYSDR